MPDDSALGAGMTFRYVGPQFRLFFGAYTTKEYTVPNPSLTTPYPTATQIRDWGDVSQGLAVTDTTSNCTAQTFHPSGIYWDSIDSRLYWTYENAYNTCANTDDPSLGYSTLNDTTGAVNATGVWRFTGRGPKATSGCLVPIPSSFANAYTGGKRLAVGCGGYRSIADNGPAHMGPALTAISPPSTSTNPNRSSLPHVNLVGYPFTSTEYGTPDRAHRNDLNYDNSLHDDFVAWDTKNGIGYWTAVDGAQGSIASTWIDLPNKHGIVFFPLLGNGRMFYDCSTLITESGSHAWFVYDPADFAQVAQGQKQQWQIQASRQWSVQYPGVAYPIDRNRGAQPGSSWNPIGCSQIDNDHIGTIGGAVFDPSSQKLYVSVGNRWPKGDTVYVYQVLDTGGSAPTACDINQNGASDVSDVQLCVNQAIGTTACSTGDITQDGNCNVIDVQRVVNSALGNACLQ